MAQARAFLSASLGGLAVAVLAGILASFPLPGTLGALEWAKAHAPLALFGFLMPGLAFLHWHVAGPRMPRPLGPAPLLPWLWVAGAVLLALGHLAQPSGFLALVAFVGTLVLLAAGLWQTMLVMKSAPKRGESVVDIAKDPLTKGDDASLKHVKFAHMIFLPLPLLALAVTYAPGLGAMDWLRDVQLAAYHWLLAGYALLSTYGLSHIVVPRLCGVPAIAAGAIKGELHSSLLGLVLLATGFLWPGGSTGFLVAGGACLFLGAFVFMGVLGANIMKNKSPTQRVTPEFAYIPWTFAGVFWLIAGVLLGVFLNAAKAQMDAGNFTREVVAGLTFVHVHAALFGGFAMLLMGFAIRLLPAAAGQAPAPFNRTKWSFYGFNLALILLFYGRVAPNGTTVFQAGGILAAISLAAWFISLLPSMGKGERA